MFRYSARSKTDLPLSLGFIQLPTKTLWASNLSRDAKVLSWQKHRGLWQGLPWFVARITVVCGNRIPWLKAKSTVVYGKDYRGLWQKNREGAG